MPRSCCAFNCPVSSDIYPHFMFHCFPDENKQKDRRLKWINAIKRKDFVPTKHTRLCSSHFKDSDYDPPVTFGRLRLKKDAVPSIFNFPVPVDLELEQAREISPVRAFTLDEPTISRENETDTASLFKIEEPVCKSVAVQTVLTTSELNETLSGLRREKKCLQNQLNRRNARINNLLKLFGELKKNPEVDAYIRQVMKSNSRYSLSSDSV